MSVVNIFTKDPGATRIFGVDWVNQLDSGVTLSSVAWTVPAGITKTAQSLSGSQGLIELSGGTLGSSYVIIGAATFSDGQIDVRRITITIAEL